MKTTNREARMEKALRGLYLAVTMRNRLSEDDERLTDGRRHQQIDFTAAQLRKIGKALRLARESLAVKSVVALLALAATAEAQPRMAVVYTNAVDGQWVPGTIVQVQRPARPAVPVPPSIATTPVLPANWRPPLGPTAYVPTQTAVEATAPPPRHVPQPWYVNGIPVWPSPTGSWMATAVGRPIIDVRIVETRPRRPR